MGRGALDVCMARICQKESTITLWVRPWLPWKTGHFKKLVGSWSRTNAAAPDRDGARKWSLPAWGRCPTAPGHFSICGQLRHSKHSCATRNPHVSGKQNPSAAAKSISVLAQGHACHGLAIRHLRPSHCTRSVGAQPSRSRAYSSCSISSTSSTFANFIYHQHKWMHSKLIIIAQLAGLTAQKKSLTMVAHGR